MSDPRTDDKQNASRPPFEAWRDVPPFYRTPEFGRFLWLVGVLCFVGVFGFLSSRDSEPETAGVSQAAAKAPPAAQLQRPAETAAERSLRISTAFEGALNDTQNGGDFEETQGFRTLLRSIANHRAEEIHERATETLDYAAAMRDPDAYRGRFVRARGLMAGMHTEKLTTPMLGITDVYRGFLTDAEGEQGVAFDLTTPPPAYEMRREAVDIEGVFYRTVRYETASGRVVEVPYVVARNLTPVAENPTVTRSFLRDHFGTLLIGSALAILVVRLVMYLFQRNQRRRVRIRPGHTSMRELFEMKFREHAGRASEKPPSDPPST
jgi:hypothetical protein